MCGVVLLRFVFGDAEADEAKSFTGCALTVASPDDLELGAASEQRSLDLPDPPP